MVRGALTMVLLSVIAGCHNRLRLASPQIQRDPRVTCIVLVQSDQLSAELAKTAMDACKDAIEQRRIIK